MKSKVGYSQSRKYKIILNSWEYWPLQVLYIPLFFYACWLAIKARSLTFFTNVNPLITASGLMGSSKFEVLNHLPSQYIPLTILVENTAAVVDNTKFIQDNHLQFPLIIKPDKAERGIGVYFINDLTKFAEILQQINYPIVIQSYIDYPLEYGVFYIKMPNSSKGEIVSIVKKEFMMVTGDGISSVADLMHQNDRSYLILEKWLKNRHALLKYVPNADENILLEPIGNHNRGTKFLNENHLINAKMASIFDSICSHIPEFYYGRIDLKCVSENDLYTGENLKIMEVNGINSEPAHIYDPKISYITGLKTIIQYWDKIYEISQQNSERGLMPSSLKMLYFAYNERKKAIQSRNK